jgi:hypothetical protein
LLKNWVFKLLMNKEQMQMWKNKMIGEDVKHRPFSTGEGKEG